MSSIESLPFEDDIEGVCMSDNTISGEIEFGRDCPLNFEAILELRSSVGWPTGDNYGKIIQEGIFHVSAWLNGRLIGFVNVVGSPRGDHLIQDLCVHPDHQGKGVGERLVRMALEYSSEFHPQGVNVLFEEKNRAFFERFGFRMIGGGYMDAPTPATIIKGKKAG